LVQAWVNGSVPNYGILLDQPALNSYAGYYSSEYPTTAQRPQLVLCYTGSGPLIPTATPNPTQTPVPTATPTPTKTATPGAPCSLYPIALHTSTLDGAPVGQEIVDIYNGQGPGNFGWLSWTGEQGVPTLATSLTPPGNSQTYLNPGNPLDHTVSIADWVFGRPGVANSSSVRAALDGLLPLVITVPVWDQSTGQGSSLSYRVAGFARVQLTGYRLPGQNRISAIFWGYTTCQP
jgi:hypothetical protein